MGGHDKFLGNGFSFPIEVEPISGRIEESAYEDGIAKSIVIILRTQKGERLMRPDFGCNLNSYAFSEINYTVINEIETDVKNALILWEPRIENINVECSLNREREGILFINISYVVRKTNNPYNMVYPFYLRGEEN